GGCEAGAAQVKTQQHQLGSPTQVAEMLLISFRDDQATAWSGSRIWTALGGLVRSPWLAYLLLAALQLKVVWGMWSYRDLTSGDTSSYFRNAHGWYQSGTVNIAWSPLYTSFYGSMLFLTPDP